MYSFSGHIRYSEVDQDENLSLTGLFDYMQDCSTFQSEHLGVGLAHLRSMGRAWLLAAWNVYVDKLPHFCDEVIASTWAYGFSNAYGLRNFTVCAPDGTYYARADSQWFVLDTRAMVPSKVIQEDVDAYMSDAGERLDLPKLQRKIAVPDGGSLGTPVPVTDSLLDSNHHVNNAQYVDIAIRALDLPFERGRIDVQYRQAATLGDTIVPRICEVEGGHVVGLESPDGATFASVRVLPNWSC